MGRLEKITRCIFWRVAVGALAILLTIGPLTVRADELEVKEDLTVDGTGGTLKNPNVDVKGDMGIAGDIFMHAGVLATPYGGLGAYGNLLLHSQDFSQAAWTKTNATVAANVVAPDGTTNGATTLSTGLTAPGSAAQTVTTTVTLPYTFSVWLKAGTSTTAQLELTTNGTGATTDTSAVTLTTAWQRVSLTKTAGGGTSPTALTATLKNTGAASTTLLLWGAQLEQAATPGVYAKTTTAAIPAGRGVVSTGDFLMPSLKLSGGAITDTTGTVTVGANLASTGNLQVTGAGPHYIANGNVGIGTTAPNGKLDVRGNVLIGANSYNNALLNFNADSGTALIESTRSDNTQAGTINSNGWGQFYTNKGFGVGGDPGVQNNIFYSAYNVGIGTTVPSSKLDITTAALGTTQTTSSGLALVNTTAATALAPQQISPAIRWSGFGWKTDVTAASQAVDFRSYVVPVQGTAAPTGYLAFESSINGGAYSATPPFVITTGGNIGIGTTGPGARLHTKQPATAITGLADGVSKSSAFFEGNSVGGASWGLATGYISGSAASLQVLDAAQTTAGDLQLQPYGGNVGIGTTGPGNLFTVNQAADTTASTQGTYGIMLNDQTANRLSFGGDANYAYIQSWFSKPLQINNQGNNVILNATSGNVGIGTTAPSGRLEVANSTNGTTLLKGTMSFTGAGTLLSLNSYQGEVLNVANNSAFVYTSQSNSTTAFQVRNSAGTPIVNVDTTNGNVGIGTTGPAAKLHVVGDVAVQRTNKLILDQDATADTYVTQTAGNIMEWYVDGVKIATLRRK